MKDYTLQIPVKLRSLIQEIIPLEKGCYIIFNKVLTWRERQALKKNNAITYNKRCEMQYLNRDVTYSYCYISDEL